MELAAVNSPSAAFVAGLVTSLHCAGMCGPFVLAQVGVRLGDRPVATHVGLARLQAGLLLPYHLGRATTYMILGAVLGTLGGTLAGWSGLHWISAAALSLVALFFVAQAFGWRVGNSGGGAIADRIAGLAARLQGNGYPLGLLLGLLPCGMLYSALAVAAGTGNGWAGAAAMGAFVLGTVPALLVVGTAGAAAMHGVRRVLTFLLPPIYLINAAILLVMAAEAASYITRSL